MSDQSQVDVSERLQWAYDHRDDLIEGDPIDMFETLTNIAAEAWNQLRDERMRRAKDEASAALYPRPAHPIFIDIAMATDLHDRLKARRELFRHEDAYTSFMVVVLNYGDHLTAVSCVGGEWTGQKRDLQPRVGVPLCPNGHPLMEHGPMMRLGLVPEEVGFDA